MSRIKSLYKIPAEDFLLLDWSVEYNSLSYAEFNLVFNTNIRTIDTEYQALTTTANSGVKIYLKVGSTRTLLTRVGVAYTTIGDETENTTGTGKFNTGSTYVSPLYNSLKVVYNSNTMLLDNTNYTLEVVVFEGQSNFIRVFDLSSDNNKSSLNGNSFELYKTYPAQVSTPTGLLDLIGTNLNIPITTTGYRFHSGDRLTFAPHNGTNGIASNNVNTTFDNYVTLHDDGNSYGKYYETEGTFGFTSASSAGVTTNYDLNIVSGNELRGLLFKNNVLVEDFFTSYTQLRTKISKLIDSVDLRATASTSGVYTIYLPILKNSASQVLTLGFSPNNNVISNSNNLSITSGGSGTISVPSVNSTSGAGASLGHASFKFDYPAIPNLEDGGTIEGRFIITGSNNLLLSQNVSFNVIGNLPPTVILTSPLNNAIYGNVSGTVSISLVADGEDPENNLTKIEFYNGVTLIGTDDTVSNTVNGTATWTTGAGSYSLTAVAYDQTKTGTSTPVSIVVNSPITASIVEPLGGASIPQATTNITLKASVTATTVSSVVFLNNATNATMGVASYNNVSGYYEYTYATPAVGSYTIKAKVTDNATVNNTPFHSTPVTFTITNAAPTISMLNSTPTVINIGSSGVLRAFATDDKPIANTSDVKFYRVSTPSNVLIGSATTVLDGTYGYSWTPTSGMVGANSIYATVTDSNGIVSNSDNYSILINQLPVLSIKNTTPTSVALNSTMTITATLTDDQTITLSNLSFYDGASLIVGTITNTGSDYSISWTPTSGGNHSITARYSDPYTNVTSVAYTINVVNTAPVVNSFVSSSSSGVAGESIILTANISDINGTLPLSNVSFYYQLGSGAVTLIGAATSSPSTNVYTRNWSIPIDAESIEIYKITVVGTDGVLSASGGPINIEVIE